MLTTMCGVAETSTLGVGTYWNIFSLLTCRMQIMNKGCEPTFVTIKGEYVFDIILASTQISSNNKRVAYIT